jgi:hypothetical protein
MPPKYLLSILACTACVFRMCRTLEYTSIVPPKHNSFSLGAIHLLFLQSGLILESERYRSDPFYKQIEISSILAKCRFYGAGRGGSSLRSNATSLLGREILLSWQCITDPGRLHKVLPFCLSNARQRKDGETVAFHFPISIESERLQLQFWKCFFCDIALNKRSLVVRIDT